MNIHVCYKYKSTTIIYFFIQLLYIALQSLLLWINEYIKSNRTMFFSHCIDILCKYNIQKYVVLSICTMLIYLTLLIILIRTTVLFYPTVWAYFQCWLHSETLYSQGLIIYSFMPLWWLAWFTILNPSVWTIIYQMSNKPLFIPLWWLAWFTMFILIWNIIYRMSNKPFFIPLWWLAWLTMFILIWNIIYRMSNKPLFIPLWWLAWFTMFILTWNIIHRMSN